MSNSKSVAGTRGAKVFVLADHIERRARLEGTWLNIFDITVPPGGGTPLHSHASPEVFRILEGSLTIRRMIDGGLVDTEANAGDIITIAAHVPHGYTNRTSSDAVFSAIVDSNMAVYFEAADSGKPDGAVPADDTARLAYDAAHAHGIRILAA
jgi:quercetin dioxygenase-like cupin family protein